MVLGQILKTLKTTVSEWFVEDSGGDETDQQTKDAVIDVTVK